MPMLPAQAAVLSVAGRVDADSRLEFVCIQQRLIAVGHLPCLTRLTACEYSLP